MQIVDAHHHLWDLSKFKYDWITPQLKPLRQNYLIDDLRAVIKPAGVMQTVLVQVLHSDAETDWFLDIAEANDEIAGVVGWIDLTADPSKIQKRLEAIKHRPKLKGIRHITHDEPNNDWIAREDVLRGLKVLEGSELTFDLLFRPQHLKHTPMLAKRFPKMKMVIDHIAKPLIKAHQFGTWREDTHAAAQFPNIFAKLSGMITEADHQNWKPADLKPYIDHTIDVFGIDRVMFGTDWPVCLLAGSYQQVLDALRECVGPISTSDQQKIFADNTRKFYAL